MNKTNKTTQISTSVNQRTFQDLEGIVFSNQSLFRQIIADFTRQLEHSRDEIADLRARVKHLEDSKLDDDWKRLRQGDY